ncbi:MAG TPA: conjugative transfer ATPase [Woeseiaceae bacterium]|nr:conjugative transfer ATPase [Woeseiaceae bacterium]
MSPRALRRAPRVVDAKACYTMPPSFTDLLPWTDYEPQTQSFVLEDGVSVGAFLELRAVGTEAFSAEALAALQERVQAAISDSIPEQDRGPWVLQVYLQDEPSLEPLLSELIDYMPLARRHDRFTQAHLEQMQQHLRRLSQPNGTFKDTGINGSVWQGQIRRVRAALYRRLPRESRRADPVTIQSELAEVVLRFIEGLAAADVHAIQLDAEAVHAWLSPWFSGQQRQSDRACDAWQYPGDTSLPYGRDFAELLVPGRPVSDLATGSWWFDDQPQRVVSVQQWRRAPSIGHFSAERRVGDRYVALFDQLPAGTVLAMTVTILPQDSVQGAIGRVRHAARGDSVAASVTLEEADQVLHRMGTGEKIYPASLVFYLRGSTLAELDAHTQRLKAQMLANGLQPISDAADPLAVNAYLRHLPMAYDPALDRLTRRSRWLFAAHAANLLPVYGRSRGTRSPGLVFFNRGAEPLVFDPLSRDDRKKNAHLLVLGPTGAGKSALLIYMLQQMIAVHRPRVFLIEVGGSFTLFAEHCRKLGLSVNLVAVTANSDVSLPPFAGAVALAKSLHVPSAEDDPTLSDEIDDDTGGRDRLGEMEIAARIMITGGDAREDARLTRADRLLIRNAILTAARRVHQRRGSEVITDDVVAAIREHCKDATLPEHRRLRALEMADGMALFCSGFAGRLFNRGGVPWPEADLTVLEMGLLAREGYEDQLTLAYVSMMNHINHCIESQQYSERQTLVVTDEGHVITTNPLLARYVVKITKMWRKFGAWFWIATQNLEDFPDESRRMLNMIEWWLCLVMPKEEIDQIARFRDLSNEQRRLLGSTRKEPGRFVEGVVLSDKLQALFRNVPPPLSLALAMTEKHEKAERAAIMARTGGTELEAAYAIAASLETAGEQSSDD